MKTRIPYTEDALVAFIMQSYPDEETAIRAYVRDRIAEVKNKAGRAMSDTMSIDTVRQWRQGYRPRRPYVID